MLHLPVGGLCKSDEIFTAKCFISLDYVLLRQLTLVLSQRKLSCMRSATKAIINTNVEHMRLACGMMCDVDENH